MKQLLYFFVFGIIMLSCKQDKSNEPDECADVKPPKKIELDIPFYLDKVEVFYPKDNPLTEEGVKLGRKLFYEKKLSGDNSMSCASCHVQENGFSDPRQFSTGIDGLTGDRNAMAVINLVFSKHLFWDGRAELLEGQALGPVVNPIEMHETWPNAASKIKEDKEYVKMFEEAFGCNAVVDSNSIVNAIAQFERTMLSFGSKYDERLLGKYIMNEEEIDGFNIFTSERGDCFHCHLFQPPTFTDNLFHNNGLDSVFTDVGLESVTGRAEDKGKFRTPTLRNIEFTAPYMHDGRFQTLEEVIEFYSSGLKKSPTIDPLMKKIEQGGVRLNTQEKKNLLAFLKLLNDKDFMKNKDFSDPN